MQLVGAEPVALLLGRVFHGRYEVVRCLRTGGMGAVYEVVDQKTHRRRALKVMLPTSAVDADLRARFRLEATITAAIPSEHLVETVDADIDAETGAPFVVMELLDGEDLGEAIARRGALPQDEVVALLQQVALVLDRTHAAGVVHRDLKPENLFVTTRDDGSGRIKVLDFGIAKVVAASGAPLNTTRAMGTPLYMPPEQIRGDGDIGPPADVYALAQVAYALLVGEPYWTEESAASPALYAIFSRICAGPSELATARAARRSAVVLPPAFDAWFARATAALPADRHPDASALVAALADALALTLTRSSRAGVATPPPREAAALAPTRALSPLARTTGSVVSGPEAGRADGRAPLRVALGAALLAVCAGAVLLSLRGRTVPSAAGEAGALDAAAASSSVAPLALAPSSALAATSVAPLAPAPSSALAATSVAPLAPAPASALAATLAPSPLVPSARASAAPSTVAPFTPRARSGAGRAPAAASSAAPHYDPTDVR